MISENSSMTFLCSLLLRCKELILNFYHKKTRDIFQEVLRQEIILPVSETLYWIILQGVRMLNYSWKKQKGHTSGDSNLPIKWTWEFQQKPHWFLNEEPRETT